MAWNPRKNGAVIPGPHQAAQIGWEMCRIIEASRLKDKPVITAFQNSLLVIALLIGNASMAQENKMGDVNNNSGIVTQGQVGNNYLYQGEPRDPQGLYQGGKKIGTAQGVVAVDNANGVVQFQAL